MHVEYLVVHTADHGGIDQETGQPWERDTTAEEIDRWHREERGWSEIGYHAVVRWSGQVEPGRDERRQGAHVLGLNNRSLGVCCSGAGDYFELKPMQIQGLRAILMQWMDRYHVPAIRVIGHREAKNIPGVPDPGKTCPGLMVNMDEIRSMLS
jgi:hypothetical protein